MSDSDLLDAAYSALKLYRLTNKKGSILHYNEKIISDEYCECTITVHIARRAVEQ